MFAKLITRKSKILAVILVLCMIIACVPTVFAETTDSSSDGNASSGGFVTLDEDGGTLQVGTARLPKSNGNFVVVKYIYSKSIFLNEKSIKLIRSELKNCGITISEEMMVSDSDIPAELIGKNDRRAIFACGSADAPTELTAYTPAKTAEESFKLLYPAYDFSISEYTSLNVLFAGSDAVTLSEDGQTAYCSVVMDESYTEKIINGKPVTILMINSEYKYTLCAPKITFTEDEFYVTPSDAESPEEVTNSDVTEPTASTTAPTSVVPGSLTAAATAPSIEPTEESSSASTTESSTAATTTTTTASTTSTSLTAAASAEITSSSKKTTTSTSVSTTTSVKSTVTTSSTTKKSTTKKSTTSSTTASTTKNIKPSVTTTTSTTSRSNPVFNSTTINSLSSEKGIVNTRRLPLNIRSGPGKNYMVVTVLPKGTYVTVLSTENPDWYMVKTMGKVVGYAYSKYIRIM